MVNINMVDLLSSSLSFLAGACLLLACLSGEWLIVANVGDSRAVLGSYMLGSTRHFIARLHYLLNMENGYNAKIYYRTLTNDHNATNTSEARLARFRFLFNNGLLSPNAKPGMLIALS